MADNQSAVHSQVSSAHGSRRALGVVLMRSSLFPALHVFAPGSRGHGVSNWNFIVELLQPFAFVVNPYVGGSAAAFAVPYTLALPLWDGTDFYASGIGEIGFQILFWACVALISCVLAAQAIAMYTRGMVQHVLLTNVATSVAHATTTSLFQPVLLALLIPSVCDASATSLYFQPHETCPFQPGSSTLSTLTSIVGIVAAVLHSAFAYVLVTAVAERDRFAFTRLKARAHGFVDSLEVLMRAGVAVSFLFLVARNNAAGAVFVSVSASTVLCAAHAVLLPYFNRKANSLKAGAYAAAAASGVVTYANGRTADPFFEASGGLYVVLVAASAIAGFCGWKLAQWRWSPLTDDLLYRTNGTFRHANGRRTPFEEALHSSDAGLLPFPAGLVDSEMCFSSWSTVCVDVIDEATEGGEFDDAESVLRIPQVVSPSVDAVYVPTDIEVASRFIRDWTESTAQPPTAHMKSFAARLFAKGISTFPGSEDVRLGFVRFLAGTAPSAGRLSLGITVLDQVAAAPWPSLCGLYQVFVYSQALRKAIGLRDRSRQDLLAAAKRAHRDALAQTVQLWRNAGRWTSSGHLPSLSHQCAMVGRHHREALSLYHRGATLAPDDDQIMMSFSSFLTDVLHDEIGSELRIAAEQIASSRRSSLMRKDGRSQASSAVHVSADAADVVAKINLSSKATHRTKRNLQLLVGATCALLLLSSAGYILSYFMFDQVHTKEQSARRVSELATVSLELVGSTQVAAEAADALLASGEDASDENLAQFANVLALSRAAETLRNSILFGKATITATETVRWLAAPRVSFQSPRGQLRLSMLEVLDQTIAAAHSIGTTPSAEYSTVGNSTHFNTIVASATTLAAGFIELQERVASNAQDQTLVSTIAVAVIFGAMMLVAASVLSGVAFQMRAESVSKALFLQLFSRIPRHALQQMTSKARHAFSTFTASEQDDDADWGEEEDPAGGVPTVTETKPAAAGAEEQADVAKSAKDEDEADGAEPVDITEDEVKHSALLSLVVRRGSVNVQRITHLGKTIGDEAAALQAGQEAAEANTTDHFEADFNAAWRESMVTTNTVADWDTIESTSDHRQHQAKAHQASTAKPMHDGRSRLVTVLSLLFAVAAAGTAVAAGAIAFEHETGSGPGLIDHEARQAVLYLRTFVASGSWRAYEDSVHSFEALSGSTQTLHLEPDSTSAEWNRVVDESVVRLLSISRIAMNLGARAARLNSTLAPEFSLSAAAVEQIRNGSLSLWGPSTIDEAELESNALPLPWSNSSVDLCAACGTTLSEAERVVVSGRAVAVATAPITENTLELISHAAANWRAARRQHHVRSAQTLQLTIILFSVAAAVFVLVFVSLSCELFAMRNEAHAIATTVVSLVVVALASASAAVVCSSAAAQTETLRQTWVTSFDVAQAAGEAIAETDLVIYHGVTFAMEPSQLPALLAFQKLDAALSPDSLVSLPAALQSLRSAHATSRLSDVFAASTEVLQLVRTAVRLAAESNAAAVTLVRGRSYNRTAEAGFAVRFIELVNDNVESPTEQGRASLPAAVAGPFYSVPLSDLSAGGASVARRIVASQALSHSAASRSKLATSLHEQLSLHGEGERASAEDKFKRLQLASVIVGGLTALGVLAVATSALLTAIARMQGGADGAERLYDREFRPMVRSSVLVPLAIVIGFAAIFGTCVGLLDTRSESIATLAGVFERVTVIQQATLASGNLRRELQKESLSVKKIAGFNEELVRAVNNARRLRTKGLFSGKGWMLRKASDLNGVLFGPTDARTVRVPATTECFPSFDAQVGNQQDIDSITAVLELAFRRLTGLSPSDLTGSAAARASALEIIAEAQLNAGVAIDKLVQVSATYASALDTTNTRDVAIVGALYGIVAVVVIATLLGIVLPLEQQIDHEADTIALLLASLPDDVKSNVPELSEYFNAGTFGDDEKKNLAQSEQLLQNILPPVISRRLKSGESPIADDHKSVTVVFAALVNFDKYSDRMEAREMVVYLNKLIVTFDDVVDQLELEKIKTIGDTYFLCGGLTSKTAADHPLRSVECGLNFMEALEEFSSRNAMPDLKLRVGVHTGAAVAGVIGSSKVAYDLWGDTVNTSSRMQSTGRPGGMQLHASTHQHVKDYFSFDESFVNAKGKGKLTTYLWSGRKGLPSPYHGKVNWRKSLQ